jgi:peptidoglycan/xylan/chitin deacetylase (PgdA/CDA1 family)
MLQTALPETLRQDIADNLFRRYVSEDAKAFAQDLYLSEGQIREMISAGAHFGSHGARHQRLSRLSPGEQRADIEASLDFLSGLGVTREGFTFCYPYGDHDSATVDILRTMGCRAALTLLPGTVEIGADDPLLLKRLDTNDLPKDRNAPAPA